MNKKLIAGLLFTLGLSLIPVNHSNAYLYDAMAVSDAMAEPAKHPELNKYQAVKGLPAGTDEDMVALAILQEDLAQGIDYVNAYYSDSEVGIGAGVVSWFMQTNKKSKLPENSIRIANLQAKGAQMVSVIYGMRLTIENKTNTVMELDMSKSYITLAGKTAVAYDSKSLLNKYSNKQGNLGADIILLAPGETKTESIRLDTGFKLNNYLLENAELMGKSTFVINSKPVTIDFSAKVNTSKLGWKCSQ